MGESNARGNKVMSHKIGLRIRYAILAGCAVAERVGITDPWHVCGLVAAAEGVSRMRVRRMLAQLWGDGLVANGSVRLTEIGWREVNGEDVAA